MPHNLILFGAGASHGSDTGGTPPLMRQLFDELKSRTTEWKGLCGNTAEAFRRDFEEAMRLLLERDANLADKLQRGMAGYFFHFRPRPTNLYAKLAGRIRETQWDGALVTLNYERLLELALRNAGINLVVNPPRPNAAELELCLPHGCCHLFGHLRAIGNLNFGGNIVFDDAPGSVPRVIENAEKHACELKENKLPPIMCYIEPDKRNRTGVSFISGQRKRFECLAHSASVVGIIGVNVRSRDAHIWGPLADTPARIVYCARASGARHYSVWAEEHRPNRGDTLLLGDFEDEFDTICDAVGL